MPEARARHYALVPAAGRGTRFGGNGAKQYLPLVGRPLIYHALATLCKNPSVDRVFVVLASDDQQWDSYDWNEFAKLSILRCGGESRARSVLNALDALVTQLAPDDWVLVHDAARPCLDARDLSMMIEALANDAVGGLLAAPLADTLKRADRDSRIVATLERDALWRAQTPQMFRYGIMRAALTEHIEENPTDEASVIERCGLRPRLVPGSVRNIKITYPDDLAIAELFLRHP